jgi:hypothetical protein
MTSTLIHYDFITLRIFDKEYESLRSSSRVLSCLLLLPPHGPKHIPQHSVLTHSQSIFLPNWARPSSIAT